MGHPDEFDLQLARMLRTLALPRPLPGSLGLFWQNRWTARLGEDLQLFDREQDSSHSPYLKQAQGGRVLHD